MFFRLKESFLIYNFNKKCSLLSFRLCRKWSLAECLLQIPGSVYLFASQNFYIYLISENNEQASEISYSLRHSNNFHLMKVYSKSWKKSAQLLKISKNNLVEFCGFLCVFKYIHLSQIESYWTYEVCHGKHIRQYHEEKESGQVFFSSNYDIWNIVK